MGMEFQVSSLEEMCDLMCDNIIPKRKHDKEKYISDNNEELEVEQNERTTKG